MNCDDRDIDLLLTATGDAGIVTSLCMQAHLLGCARCRERFGEFASATAILSDIRGARPALTGLSGYRAKFYRLPLAARFTAAVLSMAAAILLFSLMEKHVRASDAVAATPFISGKTPTTPATPCVPGQNGRHGGAAAVPR